LTELSNSGDALVKSFSVFLTYPFVDEVVGRDPQVARNLHMGDYTNLSIELDLDLSGGIKAGQTTLPPLLPSEVDPTVVLDRVAQCLRSGDLTSKACQQVLGSVQGLLKLREACLNPKNKDKLVCTALNQVPGLPQLPGLDGVGGLLGRNRAAVGPTPRVHGPTIGQLSRAFDPALVHLLVPGMVTR
jgi:phospholipid/cholesterol/gamma-HCH transport system substrate-binding protein